MLDNIKASNDAEYPSRPRIANAYRFWISPDMKRSGVRQVYQDKYSAFSFSGGGVWRPRVYVTLLGA